MTKDLDYLLIKKRIVEIWKSVLETTEELDDNDNFFEIGGHSLQATLVLLEYQKETGFEIPIHLFFENPILCNFVKCIYDYKPIESNILALTPRKKFLNILPVSLQQRQMWLIDQLENSSEQYNIAINYEIIGDLCYLSLQSALDELLKRHEILNTAYINNDGEVEQHIKTDGSVNLDFNDLSKFDKNTIAEKWKEINKKSLSKKFNLTSPPLIRGLLVKINDNSFILQLVIHHIAFDGWSNSILNSELALLYKSYKFKKDLPLHPKLQYSDYVLWINQRYSENEINKNINFWMSHLSDVNSLNDIPTDYPRNNNKKSPAAVIRKKIDVNLLAGIIRVSKNLGVTQFVVLHAVFALLLSRLNEEDTIVLGTPVANRDKPELSDLIGYFVNSVVLKTKIDYTVKISDYIKSSGLQVQKSFKYQPIMFENLVQILKPERDLSFNPIFQIMFVLQNTPVSIIEWPNLEVTQINVDNPIAKFDLVLNLLPKVNIIEVEWEYDTSLFDSDTINNMSFQYHYLLEQIISNSHYLVSDLKILPYKNFIKINEVNDNTISYQNIGDRFKEMVLKRKNKIAVKYKNSSFSYNQLNKLSDDLAKRIVHSGVKSGGIVAFSLLRSVKQIITLLAIVKSGASYVPIDINYPLNRKIYILNDCGAELLIICNKTVSNFSENNIIKINVDDNTSVSETSLPEDKTELAYIMYTSGTTGKPKGVRVKDKGILRLVVNNNYVIFNQSTIFLYAASPSFDAATLEIWGALLNGGCLVIYPDEGLDMEKLILLVKNECINILFLTAGALEGFSETLDDDLRDLKWLLTGGDVVPPNAVKNLYQQLKLLTIINCYGPTEITTIATSYNIPRNFNFTKAIPIGRPINNTNTFVVDHFGNEVGMGIPGELWLGGCGVADGYQNLPELTDVKFVLAPDLSRGICYKTGDKVCWQSDGNLRFIGRVDNQVKIRGFRIELNEIENQICKHENITTATVAVIGEQASQKKIIAWCKVRMDNTISVSEITEWLKISLPKYMLPSQIILVDEMPLNSNGKVDRNELFKLLKNNFNKTEINIKKNSPQENKLAEIWGNLLNLTQLPNKYDDFFYLGGSSLNAVQLVARITKEFGTKLNVVSIVINPRLIDMLKLINDKNKSVSQLIVEMDYGYNELTKNESWICIPGIGSTAAVFNSLAKELTSYGKVYSFTPKGLDFNESPHLYYKEMIDDFLDVLLPLVPNMKINLIGHSFGGRVAIDLGLRLLDKGYNPKIILLDILPDNKLVDIRYEGGTDDFSLAEWFLDSLGVKFDKKTDPMTKLKDIGEFTDSYLLNLFNLLRAQFNMLAEHELSPYVSSLDIQLIYASKSLIGKHSAIEIKDSLMSSAGACEISCIDSGHFNMLQYGKKLATLICQSENIKKNDLVNQ